MSLKIISIVGNRPQFIKLYPIIRAIKEPIKHIIIHTGQHYDYNLDKIFFNDLKIPDADYNLNIGSGSHCSQISEGIRRIESILIKENPDWVLVYGDTNSTLIGALASVKLQIRIAHIEAGLRSYDMTMPEETNRKITDICSTVLFCPTKIAIENLRKEGMISNAIQIGDVMYDAVLQFGALARERSTILNDLGLTPRRYLLATVHRPYNTDDPERLQSILEAFIEIGEPIVFSVHPRTRRCMAEFGLDNLPTFQCSNVQLVEPVGYLDMLMLEQHARLILTDSGGVQKEAYFFAVPCVTLRPETEWVETVDAGSNVVVDTDQGRIVWAANDRVWPDGTPPPVFGDGRAGEKMMRLLEE